MTGWHDSRIAQTRYELEPYIPEFARFSQAAGKSVLEIGVGAGSDFLEWCRNAAHATIEQSIAVQQQVVSESPADNTERDQLTVSRKVLSSF